MSVCNPLEFVRRLRTAFAGTKRPDMAHAFLPDMLPDDSRVAREVFCGQDREQITLAQVRFQGDLLFFMSAEAFHWFLPCMMELCLSSADVNDTVELYDKIRFLFRRKQRSQDYLAAFYSDLERLLSPAQREVIRNFLACYMEIHPEVEAIGPGELWV
jgi:hypothetical protein